MIEIPYGYAVTHNEVFLFALTGFILGTAITLMLVAAVNRHKQREKLISQMCTKDKELYQKFFRNL